MKIHPDTLTVLKNFARIHKGLTVPVGNVLTTITPLKTIMARATTPTSFEKRFTVYDLDRFLGVVSLFDADAEYAFDDKYVTISDSSRSVRYTYADESVIKTKAPVNDIVMPSIDAQFSMSLSGLKSLEKALGVMGLPHVQVQGTEGKVYLQATDSKNPLVDVFSIEVGTSDREFRAILKKENFSLFPSDYEVKLTQRGMANFKGKLIEYWIALEEDSTFDGKERE